jgi:hypothetical protein
MPILAWLLGWAWLICRMCQIPVDCRTAWGEPFFGFGLNHDFLGLFRVVLSHIIVVISNTRFQLKKYPVIMIVLWWICRGSLYSLLHAHDVKLSWSRILYLCLGTAQGMQHLHVHNVVHRDLKSGAKLMPPRCTLFLFVLPRC